MFDDLASFRVAVSGEDAMKISLVIWIIWAVVGYAYSRCGMGLV